MATARESRQGSGFSDPPLELKHLRTTSIGSNCPALPSGAESLIRSLVPHCAAQVFTRMQREGIFTVVDLGGLDKNDLRELGLTMLEGSKVYHHLRPRADEKPEKASDSGLPESPNTPQSVLGLKGPNKPFSRQSSFHSNETPATPDENMIEADKDWQRQTDLRVHLDSIEAEYAFWFQEVGAPEQPEQPDSPLRVLPGVVAAGPRPPAHGELDDIRENVLEARYDLTPGRILEVFKAMDLDRNKQIDEKELREGLRRCGLPGIDDIKLATIAKTVSMRSDSSKLEIHEFRTIITRLSLARLLHPSQMSLFEDGATDLIALDYNSNIVNECRLPRADLPKFFFGHRPHSESGSRLVRWVHMGVGYLVNDLLPKRNLTLLFALTVKYQLHPLGVEDVIEQCPTRIERYGASYFVAIEQLRCITFGVKDGSIPVQVQGRHIAMFFPNTFDTVITIAQPDHSMPRDWPGSSTRSSCTGTTVEAQNNDQWVIKLRNRLHKARSRVRERGGDFLMYEILDSCADSLVDVTKAYSLRLRWLEERLRMQGQEIEPEYIKEVSEITLQLDVVIRRVRGLQRVVRRLHGDADMASGLPGYLQDVAGHLEEAHEDAFALRERSTAFIEAHQRAADKMDEHLRRQNEVEEQKQKQIMNETLFVLTVLTSIFSPMHFLAGVYGMNFVNADGTPTIPELLWRFGYEYFWIASALYFCLAVLCARRKFRELKKYSLSKLPDLQKYRACPGKNKDNPRVEVVTPRPRVDARRAEFQATRRTSHSSPRLQRKDVNRTPRVSSPTRR